MTAVAAVAAVLLGGMLVAAYGAVMGNDAQAARDLAGPFIILFLVTWAFALYRVERHRDQP